jgi:arylsulfatase A-like enzyme
MHSLFDKLSRTVLSGASGLGAVLLATGCGPAENGPAGPKNVVLISIDTVRYDSLSVFGNPEPTSPAIDRVARMGTSFSNASASSPWTLPSHASLLSGLYPHRHRVRNHEHKLPEDIETLTEILAGSSMQTAGIVSVELLGKKHGFERDFDSFLYVPEWRELSSGDRFLANPGVEVTDRALKWLGRNADDPFFLFLHYYDAHSDYAPRSEYRERFVDPYEGRADGSTGQLLEVRSGTLEYTAEDAAHTKQLYEAEIRELDDQLARIFAYLDESGLADSTLVVVTSDHGEEFLEHGSVLHGRTYFDEVIRVPLILRGPGIPAGQVVDVPVSLVDVTPTILDQLGLPVPEAMQGLPLAGTWSAPEAWTRGTVIAEADWQNRLPESFWMIRGKRYKLIYDWRNKSPELYDMLEDPEEASDLSEEKPELTSALIQELEDTMESYRSGETRVEISEEELDRLRSLGYVR